tara:strand:+ start:111 stop:263 length:153 start_codon:yes stop_codon:yes gene_type:complete
MNLPEDYKEMLTAMAEDIDGTIQFYSTSNSMGRQSKKIVIEYDVSQKETD